MTVSEYGGLEPFKIQNEIQGSTMKLREETNEKKKETETERAKLAGVACEQALCLGKKIAKGLFTGYRRR